MQLANVISTTSTEYAFLFILLMAEGLPLWFLLLVERAQHNTDCLQKTVSLPNVLNLLVPAPWDVIFLGMNAYLSDYLRLVSK